MTRQNRGDGPRSRSRGGRAREARSRFALAWVVAPATFAIVCVAAGLWWGASTVAVAARVTLYRHSPAAQARTVRVDVLEDLGAETVVRAHLPLRAEWHPANRGASQGELSATAPVLEPLSVNFTTTARGVGYVHLPTNEAGELVVRPLGHSGRSDGPAPLVRALVGARVDSRSGEGDAPPTPGDGGPPGHFGWNGAGIRPARADGSVALFVAIAGQQLSTWGEGEVWIRAHDRRSGAPVAGATVVLSADGGVVGVGCTANEPARTDTRGWARCAVRVTYPVAGATIVVTGTSGSGEWFGPLPVGRGQVHISCNGAVCTFTAPPTVRELYVEAMDERGLLDAAVLPLRRSTEGTAVYEAWPVAPHAQWIVAAEAPPSAGIAAAVSGRDGEGTRAFAYVGNGKDGRVDPTSDASGSDGLPAALHGPPPLRLDQSMDGLAEWRERRSVRRARGLCFALAGLACGAILSLAGVFASRRRGQESTGMAPDDLSEEEASVGLRRAGGRRDRTWMAVGLVLISYGVLALLVWGTRGT